jgi:hypothetical protein
VDEGDGGRAFADGGSDPFDRSLAHVTGGEHPGQAGFKRQWRPAGGPAVAIACQQVRAGEDGPPLVARDAFGEPLCPGLGADEDEQGIGGDAAPGSGGGVWISRPPGSLPTMTMAACAPGGFAAHGGGQLLLRCGGNAGWCRHVVPLACAA